MMTSLSTAVFRKLRSCPSAEMLLHFSEEAATREGGGFLASHLAACDFCGAERQLLARHAPCACAPAADAEMPANLRRLAEDLLAQPTAARPRFFEAVSELDRLTLTTDACESIT